MSVSRIWASRKSPKPVFAECFQDLLPLPGVRGKRKRTGTSWSGWSALGERGMKRTKRDPKPLSDEYEEGEVAMWGWGEEGQLGNGREQVSIVWRITAMSGATSRDVLLCCSAGCFDIAAAALMLRSSCSSAVRRAAVADIAN